MCSGDWEEDMKWNQNNICIYGLGAYGLRTYFFLKEYGIETMCFGDRDERKCGYALEGDRKSVV